ncbi:putative leader peptide [Nonomuraea sp. LP-02]|uniref:putative leader peptide n=1 Tax=Nonomuraea sp. LP-02 TaxID=3097960 RepID=UPI003FA59A13
MRSTRASLTRATFWENNRRRDLRELQGQAPRGLPRRFLVRLPAPEPRSAGGIRARLATPGVAPESGPELGQSHTLDPVLDIPDPQGIVGDMPADPMLVGRRHVDLQRVRSAICCDAR